MRTFLRILLFAVVMSLPFIAVHYIEKGNSADTPIRVRHAHAHPTVGDHGVGVVYLNIENHGDQNDVLESISTPVAGLAEIHSTEMTPEGVMKMRTVDNLEIPAGETVKLTPGGLHLMLMQLNSPLKKGETFPVTLKFQRSGEVRFETKIKLK